MSESISIFPSMIEILSYFGKNLMDIKNIQDIYLVLSCNIHLHARSTSGPYATRFECRYRRRSLDLNFSLDSLWISQTWCLILWYILFILFFVFFSLSLSNVLWGNCALHSFGLVIPISIIHIYSLLPNAKILEVSVSVEVLASQPMIHFQHATTDDEQWLLELLTSHRSASRQHLCVVHLQHINTLLWYPSILVP